MAPRNTRVNPEVETRGGARSFAQTLDNFYAPSRDRRSEQATQKGISGFSGILEEKANRLIGERREGEFTQGTADAMREEAGEEMKGVKTGSIFRQHSSYYMAGLNETRGKAAASRFKDETARAYEEWSGKNADDDGAGFRQFMNDRVGGFMETLGDDQSKIAGALPIINEVARNYAVQHTAFTNQRLQNESMEAYDEIVSGVFSDLASGEFDMEMAIAAVANEADMMYETDGAEANDRVVAAALRHANIHNDPTAILLMAKAHDSGKLRLSQANRERLADGMDAVEADIERNANKEASRDNAAHKARKQEVQNSWYEQLVDDPYTDITEWTSQNGVEGMFFKDLEGLQSSMMRGMEVENPNISNSQRIGFEADLHNASGSSAKLAVLNTFTQSNPNAMSGADISRYAQQIMGESDPNSAVNNPTIAKFRQGFGDTLGTFADGSSYTNTDQSPFLKTQGVMRYNEYVLAKGAQVDMKDPAAIMGLHREAEAYAMEQLTAMFPNQMGEKLESQPDAGAVLGVPGALETNQARLEQEAVDEFTQMANQGITNMMPQDPEAPTEAPGPELPIEEQPTPFEDADSEEEYPPMRAGFYGEMIQRLTDGRDGRDVLRSASVVLQEDPEFSAGIDRLGEKYNINPMALVAVMDFETRGTFSADIKNGAGSGATGIIQFLPKTAVALGTSTEELALMSRSEQLVYVEKYLDQFGSRIRGGEVDDVYMAVLYPKAIGKPDGFALFTRGTKAYEQNKGLDTNGDGQVTKFEAAAKVKSKFFGY